MINIENNKKQSKANPQMQKYMSLDYISWSIFKLAILSQYSYD